jgi:hypothetical protein
VLRSRFLAALLCVAGAAVSVRAAGASVPAVGRFVTVDVQKTATARLTGALQGYAYDPRVASVRMRPPTSATYRLDAGIDRIYDCRTGRLSPAGVVGLNRQIDTIFAAGASPIVILDYMPACLADAVSGDPRSSRLLPPASVSVWHDVIKAVVTALVPARVAAGRRPVHYFEAWNEPDGLFWQGTLAQYVSNVELPAGAAVTEVAARSRVPLAFSVAATTFPDPAWQVPLLTAARHAGIPVCFVSWHYYANYPALGPDGGEPGENPVVATVGGRTNPAADPLSFGAGVQLMRQTAQQALGRVPELVLDEWNLSAGGFDLRNDSYVGAGFQAATLIELADAGVDRALLYASVDPHGTDQAGKPLPVRHGDWGVVDRTGVRKPCWYAQQLFGRLRGRKLMLDAHPQPDLWLAGTRDRDGTHLLAAAFTAHPTPTSAHVLTVQLRGLAPGRHRITSTRIDAAHLGAQPEPPTSVTVDRLGAANITLSVDRNGVQALTIAS